MNRASSWWHCLSKNEKELWFVNIMWVKYIHSSSVINYIFFKSCSNSSIQPWHKPSSIDGRNWKGIFLRGQRRVHLLVRILRPTTQSLDDSLGRRAPSAELGSGWWRDAKALTEPKTRAENRQCVDKQQKETLLLSSLTLQGHINATPSGLFWPMMNLLVRLMILH